MAKTDLREGWSGAALLHDEKSICKYRGSGYTGGILITDNSPSHTHTHTHTHIRSINVSHCFVQPMFPHGQEKIKPGKICNAYRSAEQD